MKDVPILFRPEMVRALLDGRKTQTRRPVWSKREPSLSPRIQYSRQWGGESAWYQRCRAWQASDRELWLWVRETGVFGTGTDNDGRKITLAQYKADVPIDDPPFGGRWHPSIHMPRWASRLTLRVTDMRMERLQEISCADAIAEGIPRTANSQTIDCDTPDPRQAWRELWISIHGAESWKANPELVAITFEVHKGNIDDVKRDFAQIGECPG